MRHLDVIPPQPQQLDVLLAHLFALLAHARALARPKVHQERVEAATRRKALLVSRFLLLCEMIKEFLVSYMQLSPFFLRQNRVEDAAKGRNRDSRFPPLICGSTSFSESDRTGGIGNSDHLLSMHVRNAFKVRWRDK